MSQDKEIREAIKAGERALTSLRQAESDLKSARGWGVYDTMTRGGFLAKIMKNRKTDQAEENIRQAEQELSRFAKELSDVPNVSEISAEISDFVSFVDYSFDGPLTKLYIQKKIKQAREKVDEAIEQVETVLQHLKSSNADGR